MIYQHSKKRRGMENLIKAEKQGEQNAVTSLFAKFSFSNHYLDITKSSIKKCARFFFTRIWVIR